jgi:hypothetical protein
LARGKRWAALMGVATEQSASRLYSVCLDGNYPIELREGTAPGSKRHRIHACQCRPNRCQSS